jgi:hypothetical protein
MSVEQEFVEWPQPSVEEPSNASEFCPVALTDGVMPDAKSPVRRKTTIIIVTNTRLFGNFLILRRESSLKNSPLKLLEFAHKELST